MKPRSLLPPVLLALFATALLPATGVAQARHDHAAQELAAIGAQQDPFAPVYLVTSHKLFRDHIQTVARDAVERRDRLGTDLVIARVRAHQLSDISHRIHEREKHCGGYFAFASQPEAEAFLRSDRSVQAMRAMALAAYTIDNQATVAPWLQQVQEANIRATIQHLSTAYPNRYYASGHGRNAALWIRDTWLALGHGRADVSAELFTACGNCGTQPSVILTVRGSELPDEIVVVGGHLDSISNSYSGSTMIAPGADDDASGISTITEVIRIALANGWKPKRTVKFMGYAAEEVGLRGSYAIAQSFRNQNQNVVGVLQLDMTNYAAGSTLAMRLITDYSNPTLQQYVTDLFDAYLAPMGLTRGLDTCGYACSDHASWTSAGYPAAFMFEPTFFSWLHTPRDTLPEMGGSAATSVNFARLALAFVGELGKTGTKAESDFDGDRRSDVFWRHSVTGRNTIWRSANVTTQQTVSSVVNLAWTLAGRGDFNGDGRSDVLWRNASSGANEIWLSANSSTRQAIATVPGSTWQIAAVGDFDGDSKADLFWRNTSTGANRIWWAANAALPQAASTVTDQNWQVAGVGDFDVDGRADLLWRNHATGFNAIWRSGSPARNQLVTSVTNLAWKVAGVGDFNNDGRSDIFWRNMTAGTNTVWLSASSATQQGMATVSNLNWKVGAVGDYDGDGKADVLWRNGSTGLNEIWRAGNFATRLPVAPVSDPNWKVAP